MNNGNFIISLDFELMWGVRDKKTREQYGKNIEGVHTVIPRLLEIFSSYDIKATFSTVGFLFFENKRELLNSVPLNIPHYNDSKLSPYNGHFSIVGEDYKQDIYHFAPDLIRLIQKYPGQEIGTHTFSHYYCLEPGQSVNDFRSDIRSAVDCASKYGITLTSLVFPRNQINDAYLKVCIDSGIICYRGNEHSWLYKAKNTGEESLFRRALRLLDAYINISGHNCYPDKYFTTRFPVDIPSSRFLRPWSKNSALFDRFRLRRIRSSMTFAAKNDLTFHLWWHPHNFGINQDENFKFLEKILVHYRYLNKKYNFQSDTMSALAKKFLSKNEIKRNN